MDRDFYHSLVVNEDIPQIKKLMNTAKTFESQIYTLISFKKTFPEITKATAL